MHLRIETPDGREYTEAEALLNALTGGPVALTATVTLSERNLRTLLSKFEMDGSARTIQTFNTDPAGLSLYVVAETDDEHYGARDEPPGIMHPTTERALASGRGQSA